MRTHSIADCRIRCSRGRLSLPAKSLPSKDRLAHDLPAVQTADMMGDERCMRSVEKALERRLLMSMQNDMIDDEEADSTGDGMWDFRDLPERLLSRMTAAS